MKTKKEPVSYKHSYVIDLNISRLRSAILNARSDVARMTCPAVIGHSALSSLSDALREIASLEALLVRPR